MKIMRFSTGLGNNMFQYATYLQLKKMYPKEEIYCDLTWFDYTGYPFELEKVFSLDISKFNICFNNEIQKQREIFLDNLRYWKQLGFTDYMECMYSNEGLSKFEGGRSYNELAKFYQNWKRELIIVSEPHLTYEMQDLAGVLKDKHNHTKSFRRKVVEKLKMNNQLYLPIRIIANKQVRKKFLQDVLILKKPDFYGDQGIDRLKSFGDTYFNIYGNANDCRGIEQQLLDSFKFKPFNENENLLYEQQINSCNSVSIHLRVAEFYYGMEAAIRNKYFEKAINYIKHTVDNPVFFIFSDNIEWCKFHYEQLGLCQMDQKMFVEGNKEEKSYRDMQLMSLCKHNVVPNSTFSWWAAFLNQNYQKTVITPYATLPGTISF